MHFEAGLLLLLGVARAGAAAGESATVTETMTFIANNMQSVCACTVATMAPGGAPGGALGQSQDPSPPGQQTPTLDQPGGAPTYANPGPSTSGQTLTPGVPPYSNPGSSPSGQPTPSVPLYSNPGPSSSGYSPSSNLPRPSTPNSGKPPSSSVPSSKPKQSTMETKKTKTRTEAPKPSKSSGPICELPFKTAEDAKSTWGESGAENFLLHYLDTNGIKDWTDSIFQDTVAGGNQGGATFDCQSFPNGNCDLPENTPCKTYDPKPMFYVHQEIANLYNAFDTIYQELDGGVIEALGSTIQDVEKTFGEASTPKGFFSMMIGAAVFGAGMSGPAWQVAAPLTALVGVLNVAAAMSDTSDEDPADGLKKAMTAVYKKYKDQLATTVEAVFSGNFEGVKNFDGDKKKFIMDAFREGKFLSFDEKEKAVDAYIKGFRKLLTDCLVFTALAQNDYVVAMHKGIKEKSCKETSSEDTGLFMKTPDGDRCVWIGKYTVNPADIYGRGYYKPLDQETVKAMEDDYNIDLKAAFKNIIECDGGKPDFSKPPPSPEDKGYPKCVLPMEAATKDNDD